MADIEKVDLASENLVDDRLNKLKALMPEVFSESGIDFDKLRLELGDDVDEGQERYAFTWPGKADAIRQSQTVSTATLRPCVEKSRGRDGKDGSFDSDNIYIEGDNLEVLKLLQRGYHGKVRMIYIDPAVQHGTRLRIPRQLWQHHRELQAANGAHWPVQCRHERPLP